MSERHILLVNVFFAPFTYGGATVVAEQVARCLIRQTGWRVTAVSAMQRGDLAPYSLVKTEHAGIVNYVINLPPNRSYAEIYDNPQVTELAARLMDQLRPDVVHAHCVQDVGSGIVLAAHDRGIPTILSMHDFWWICDRQFMIRPDQSYCGQNPVRIEACRGCVEDFSAAQTRFFTLARRAGLADLVTYPSRFALELGEASGLARGKGVVWSNGVVLPGPGFFDAQQRRRASDPRPAFAFLGGPTQIKGWPAIRQVFSEIGRDDFVLHLVDGSPDGSWWRHQNLTPLRGEVIVHPRFSQDRMDDFYAKVDVLLFMSQWKETFGLAIREALARGIAVIQTDSGGTTEHGTIPKDRLIPIGAPASALRAQIDEALTNPPRAGAPVAVTSFDDQARAFAGFVDGLLG